MRRSYLSRYLAWFLALTFLVSCGGDEPVDPTPPTPVTPDDPNPPTPEKDTTAPTITVSKSSINVISGPSLTITGSQLKIGDDLVASWKDDKSTTCTVVITFTPTGGTAKTVNSGEKLSEDGTLQLKVSDEAGNSSEAEITLTKTDSQAPEISIKIQEKNVIAGIKVVVDGNQLYFDNQLAATWKDDFTENCKVEISLVPEEGEPRTINSGETIKDSGTLIIQVQDDYDNKATGEIKLTKTDSQAPTITLLIQEKNVIAGVKVLVKDNQLIFDQDIVATWTDDYSETFTVELYLIVDGCEPESINPSDLITKAGVLKIHVSDEFQNKTIAEITLTAVAITGLENLQNLSLQVDQDVNLLQGLTIADGLTLSKVEVEQDGVRSEIANPQSYIPQFPGTVNIILTLARPDGSTIEIKVDNLTVNALAYNKLTVTDLKPVDILPIIGQIEVGDKNVYSYIEHLRVAEATRIRDMMWEYGAGSYSVEEYQNLMMRLNTGMTLEIPKWYDNYETIAWLSTKKPDDHAATEWSIINTLINHANLIVLNPDTQNVGTWYRILLEYTYQHPSSMFVFWNSAYGATQNRTEFETIFYKESLLNLCESNRFIIYVAGTNIEIPSTWVINKICNEEYDIGHEWILSFASLANSDKNNHPERHVMVTIATNKTGDIDQTWIVHESSKFPIGFANNVLFSGRGFPEISEGKVYWPSGRYTTSDTNYFNVALTSICFQLFAEVADVDQLLEMIRATCLTNYIHLDLNEDGDTNDTYDGHPETIPLQLINPAGFFKKYDMPSSLPSTIGISETIDLEKGYYKGVIFDIPGAEVLIDGQWIAYDAKNKDIILSQNPMNLTWRINGNILRKMGYTSGQTIQGQVVTVDDHWNGLRLEVPMTKTIQ